MHKSVDIQQMEDGVTELAKEMVLSILKKEKGIIITTTRYRN